MSDNLRIDSHKLHLHPERVAHWLAGENIYPLYMELSPAGSCNHRCKFCGLDFAGYKPDFLDTEIMTERLAEMGKLGVKSIMYAGEGEPLLHKDMARIIQTTKASGIDTALTSNAVLLNGKTAAEILPCTSWIKVSLNAGTPGTYGHIHGTQEEDFQRVLKNLENAADIREKQNSGCTLGVQLVLLPENEDEVENLAGLARDAGMDYLVVKPYSHHPQSICTEYKDINYTDCSELEERLQSYKTDSFNVIFRSATMKIWDGQKRDYKCCNALPFWSYIDAKGNVWGCSIYLNEDNFLYGNIHESSFEEIWTGPKRTASLKWCAENLDPTTCRVNCRMDKINAYLWELKNPGDHVNFI
ncbi:radical SAM protein [Desulfovibrio sp. JC010]|uniref:radical SAM protein n=1 Tax=Desulfovibrio sp. JC010 TaxID=2593641 RepID=UPI0013D607DF|nr:radical SAM protein [Desulfovibrio sp. JC010]NDV26687.1 radical SAM protein [Desulfovibrio sp. JC010]